MDEKKLIMLVRSKPPLWNVKNENYNLEFLKQQLWKEIASEMNTEYEEVKDKWEELRSTFRKEYEKMKITSNGIGNNSTEWELFEELTFLSDTILYHENLLSPKPSTSREESEIASQDQIVQEYESNDTNTGYYDQPEPSTGGTSFKAPRVKINRRNHTQHVINQQLSDSDLQFLMSLSPFLKKIPEERKLSVRNKLQQVFVEEQIIRNSDNMIRSANINRLAEPTAHGIQFQSLRTIFRQ